MDSPNKTARLAGFLYVLLVIAGIFSLRYVPSTLSGHGDPALSVKNILEHETLFRLGIIVGIIGYIIFTLLPLVLYKLLQGVNKTQAVLMVTLAVMSVPVSLSNMLNKFSVLSLLKDSSYIPQDQIQAQVQFYLDQYDNGNQLLCIFWGLWLLPFGYLVFKSGFLPKFIGVLLMIGCFGYLINFAGNFFFAGYGDLGIARPISIPGGLGELGIALWLLIVGVREKKQSV